MLSPKPENLQFDLLATWQARTLAEAKGHTGMVLLSVLAHTFDEAMPTLLAAVFPGYVEPSLPCLVSAGKVDKTGAVVADVIDRDGQKRRDVVIYPTLTAMQDDFRRLADRLKLSDSDRTELFKCAQRWVVADRRLDPAFDRRDPDAKRLVH